MKKNLTYLITALLFVLTVSCTKTYQDVPAATATGVQLSANAKFGSLLTDNVGRSLYFFSRDVAGSPTCTGGCSAVWQAFFINNLAIGSGLTATDFGVVTRADGTKQNTYKGWPLYYYVNDAKAGDTNGDAVGNLWAIAKADYVVMFANSQLIGLDGTQYTEAGVAGVATSQYLTDPYGRTLYMFTRDASLKNTFTKSDFSNDNVWPMFQVSAVGSVPTVLDKTLFATINVFGKTQLAFKNHPLYYFGQDAGVHGSTKGVSFPTPGAAVWKITNNNTVAL